MMIIGLPKHINKGDLTHIRVSHIVIDLYAFLCININLCKKIYTWPDVGDIFLVENYFGYISLSNISNI